MAVDLTRGNISKTILQFAWPMMLGNLLQQMYNVADTLIVGQFLGKDALAAVGSAYSLMTFLTSILLGLCMGSGVKFSICYGGGDRQGLKNSLFLSFVMIGGIALVLNAAVFLGIDVILKLLQVPGEVYDLMRSYLWVIFWGILATFLYNFFASLLRAVGNSVTPLIFLGVSAVLNIVLDLVFVLVFSWGVEGAAGATVLSQYVSGVGLAIYSLKKFPEIRPGRREARWRPRVVREIFQLSFLTCIQQSVMNFGILMVQGLVNSFGPAVMTAFAAAVKIDSFAYMPVQDFGNAFSTFIAQNYGAGQRERIKKGIRSAALTSFLFCLVISLAVCLLARPLLLIFIKPYETEILSIGVGYLWIEGAFYCLIGWLFLFYGFYRAMKRPGMSVVLTVISLGTRVALAYILSAIPALGVTGIWMSVPIGWFLADAVGIFYYVKNRRRLMELLN
ncbi:MAG TPA: MATE family efflux transporter [Candidatus Egerieimonas intestinavium]|uniref:Probable multidrug resistance protein NorM n=1 Tax=Candidatus Egerieimonas intestinavium TaxID=2840777 RepID=A0A9D1JEU0_9FIRM|nr:MATE family efflux transporter [Candidatus Egerieimonas intestinavium]